MKTPTAKLLLLLLIPGCTLLTAARCGDRLLEESNQEACDDGNTDNRDGCSADCSLIEDGFECLTPGQACTQLCGNGFIDPNEECDTDQFVVEQCQQLDPAKFSSGNLQCDERCQIDTSSCQLIGCPNGTLDANEECDDNNNIDNDGCTSLCKIGVICDSGHISNAQGDEINFTIDPATGDCYFLVTSADDFNPAESECVQRGGNLASIASDNENTLVSKLSNNQNVWVGATDQGGGSNEGNFRWTDLTTFSFKHFDANQPDNSFGEDCVELLANSFWNDADCNFAKRPFVCEVTP